MLWVWITLAFLFGGLVGCTVALVCAADLDDWVDYDYWDNVVH